MASHKTRLATTTSTVLLFVIFFVFTVSGTRKCSDFGPIALRHIGQCESDCVANAAALVQECARYPQGSGAVRTMSIKPYPCIISGCTKSEILLHKHGSGGTKCNTVKGVATICSGNPRQDAGCTTVECGGQVLGTCHLDADPVIHVTQENDDGPLHGGRLCTRVNTATRAFPFVKWEMCAGRSTQFPLEWTAGCRGVVIPPHAMDSNYGQDYHQLRITDGDDNYVDDEYDEENDVSFNEYKTFANMLRLEREQSYWRGYEHGILAQGGQKRF